MMVTARKMERVDMFKIGEFSRLTRVSLKTLHHYDEIGLFKPAHVDPFTSYRYYTFDQLPHLNRILALKGLGFTLEQIRQLVSGDVNEYGIDVEMAYVVQGKANLMKHAGAEVHSLPAATVAYAVYTGSYDDFGAVGQLHGAMHEWITANGYRSSGSLREYYLRPPQRFADLDGVMEIQYPIEKVS
ncbi:MAG: MerR family transcriptional regulator [Anaerolineae bacterium]